MSNERRELLTIGSYLSLVGLLFMLVGAVIVYFWDAYGEQPLERFPASAEGSLEVAGSYGDSFGYINSLFTALAFAGVIVTMILQTIELRLQRVELDQTQAELRKSAEAQEASERMFALTAHLNALNVLRQGFEGYAGLGAELHSFSQINQQRILGELLDVTRRQRANLRAGALVGTDIEFTKAYLHSVARVGLARWETQFKENESNTSNARKILDGVWSEVTVAIDSLGEPTDAKGERTELARELQSIGADLTQVRGTGRHEAATGVFDDNLTIDQKREFWTAGSSTIARLVKISEMS